MPKERSEESANRQVLIRLTQPQSEVLSAIAYLRGVSGTEIVRTEVTVFLEGAASSQRVQRLIREREEYGAEESGKLRRISSARTTTPQP